MANVPQLKRMAVIINKLANGKYLSTKEMQSSVEMTMRNTIDSSYSCSLRTLQRDIRDIRTLFGIEIKCDTVRGYHIAERSFSSDDYERLLINFEILSSIDADSTLQKYVLAEHIRSAIPVDFSDLLEAIRECNTVEFDYLLVRHDNRIVHKKIEPHFLKESRQRWYLIGYDENKLKTFGVDRMSRLEVNRNNRFRRREEIDIPSLFRESFGIWNNPDDPVEEVILKYDALDGAFIKTQPLHASQEILEDDEHGITVRVRLRVTNDFVMELLSRSRSLEVVRPLALKERLREVWMSALERNRE